MKQLVIGSTPKLELMLESVQLYIAQTKNYLLFTPPVDVEQIGDVLEKLEHLYEMEAHLIEVIANINAD